MPVPRAGILRLLALSVAHLGLTIIAILSAFGEAMSQFDNPDAARKDRFIDTLADVLPQPAMALLDALGPPGLPPFAQWAVLAANSLAWALVLTVLARAVRRLTRAALERRSRDASG